MALKYPIGQNFVRLTFYNLYTFVGHNFFHPWTICILFGPASHLSFASQWKRDLLCKIVKCNKTYTYVCTPMYFVNLHVQFKYRKIMKNSVFGHFWQSFCEIFCNFLYTIIYMALQTTACKLKGEKTNTKKYSNCKHRKFPVISISKAKSKWGKKKEKK